MKIYVDSPSKDLPGFPLIFILPDDTSIHHNDMGGIPKNGWVTFKPEAMEMVIVQECFLVAILPGVNRANDPNTA